MNDPFPPEDAGGVQKLQPIGHPTDGTIVAERLRRLSAARSPITRKPNDEGISGCLMGAVGSSPRNRRSQAIPSPRTTWSASMRFSISGIDVTCPPTTIVERGE